MSSQAIGDTPVTVKVNHNGRMCRFKLPLRDMTAAALEDKLRTCLHIDPSTECVFERYSDSASAFVILNRHNIPVYKQLYRAAKAKQRLKIKVTTPLQEEEEEEKQHAPQSEPVKAAEPEQEPNEEQTVHQEAQPIGQVTKLVTVEDEPEVSTAAPSEMTEVSKMEPVEAPKSYIPPMFMQPLYYPPSKPLDHDPILQPEHRETPPARPPKEMISQEKIVANSPPTKHPVCPRQQSFSVCCNECEANIPEVHYHCGTCEDGDFDLCQKCVDQGITCQGDDHWLIKRFVRGGQIITSHTERISPKIKSRSISRSPLNKAANASQANAPEPMPAPPKFVPATLRLPIDLCGDCGMPEHLCNCRRSHPTRQIVPLFQDRVSQGRLSVGPIRTCNCCVSEYPEDKFVHCTDCDDFDLCKMCFIKDSHGHHPGHTFETAVKGDELESVIKVRLAPGRNEHHGAICDGCNKGIKGVRHKCLDCPDWDYCVNCVRNADFIHAGHRFVPIYDDIKPNANRTVHAGICCDGPLCNSITSPQYITGVRYKCAVCNDTDFCGNCEASPANTHNKTHPLIKFKTPVRHVTVTTHGDRRGGAVYVMGDRTRNSTNSRATSTITNNSSTAVQTLVDVKPAEPAAEPKPQVTTQTPVAPCEAAPIDVPNYEDLEAVYVRDLIPDGTIMPPGSVFNQTWILRNAGKVPWPAGCSVKFVGGDYMGHVDPSHPVGVLDLVSANESIVCYLPLEPGKEFAFNVLLRTPPRDGRAISYWRLSTPDGNRFGHRLWCDINVVTPNTKHEASVEVKQEPVDEATPRAEMEAQSESQMVFPKLEKESPVSSIHEKVTTQLVETRTDELEETEEAQDFEELTEDDEWDDDDSFNTDEEYDLLDASDEECSETNGKAAKK